MFWNEKNKMKSNMVWELKRNKIWNEYFNNITIMLFFLKKKKKTVKLDSLVKTGYTAIYVRVRFKLYLM